MPEGIRTPGLLIRSQALYPAELQAHMAGVTGFEPVNAGVKVLCLTAWRYPKKKSGAGEGTRTPTLLGARS